MSLIEDIVDMTVDEGVKQLGEEDIQDNRSYTEKVKESLKNHLTTIFTSIVVVCFVIGIATEIYCLGVVVAGVLFIFVGITKCIKFVPLPNMSIPTDKLSSRVLLIVLGIICIVGGIFLQMLLTANLPVTDTAITKYYKH